MLEHLAYIAADLHPLARPIDLFETDPDNARTGHDLAGIAESLAGYGQRKPIVANAAGSGPPFRITAGNGTWQAAVSLGWTHIAAVVVDEPAGDAAGYALADNALAEASRWHPERLQAALARIPQGRPVGGAGRVLELLRNRQRPAENEQTQVSADAAPKVQLSADASPKIQVSAEHEPFGVRPGDLWRLPGDGRDHFLICGDSRDTESWYRLMEAFGRAAVEGVFTSPPYAEQRANGYGGVLADRYVGWFGPVMAHAATHLAADGSLFLNIKSHSADGGRDMYVLELVLNIVKRWSWLLIDELAWRRQGFPGRYRNRFKNAWEPVYHFSRVPDCIFRPEHVSEETDLSYAAEYSAENNTTMGAGFEGQTGRNVRARNGLARPTNVITAYTGAHDPTAVTGHGATFPVQLPEFFLLAYSDPDDAWLDPFCGTGTVLVAAERTGRVGLGIEVLPEVCELALGRWARHVGQRPERVDG